MALNYDDGLSGKDIIDMIMGYQRSQIVCSASSLGIFEELHNSSMPLTASVLANRLRSDSDCIERLLNTCTALQLLEKECSDGDAVYHNASATEKFLVKSSPMSMKPLANSVAYMYPMWGRLKESVKDGYSRTPSPKQNGLNDSMFDKGTSKFCGTDAMQLDFLQAMHMFSRMDAPFLVKAFDLSEFDSACDLGGGSGALGLQLSTCYSQMQVTVLDLPHVVHVSPHFMPTPMPQNLRFESGDFFQQPLPSADLYVLSHVIHDWGADKIQLLLKKVYQTLRPGGALLVMEKTLNETKDAPLMTSLFDLGMLVVSEGRERTAAEYESVLQEAGFEEVEIKIIPQTSFRDAILARKV